MPNYLIGRRRAGWRTDIPTYGRVRYEGVWPGIGVSFYGRGGRLEYDLDLAPRADPGRIGLSFGGARGLSLRPDGALLVRLAGASARQLIPRAYQFVAGARRAVASRYVLEPGGRVGVRLGAYDHHPLVIDPALVYSTYLGGSGDESASGIAVDSTGSAYVTGSTDSANFPTRTAAQGSFAGGIDAFVTKLSPGGSSLVYSTYLGGSLFDSGDGIAVDPTGSAYVTGTTHSTDFPTRNAPQASYAGGISDAFVTKLGGCPDPAPTTRGSTQVNSRFNSGFNAGFNRGFHSGFQRGFHIGFLRSHDASLVRPQAVSRQAVPPACDQVFNQGFNAGFDSGFNS